MLLRGVKGQTTTTTNTTTTTTTTYTTTAAATTIWKHFIKPMQLLRLLLSLALKHHENHFICL
jgi:hypothetical protein